MSNKYLSTGTSGLKSNYLSFIEVLAQAVGSIAPTASLALVIPLVSSYAGNGTWLAYLFALITTVLIGICLNFFTKRSASPGSLYSYVVKGLGAKVGILAGWALLLAYVLTSAAVLDGFVNYANALFSYGKIAIPAIVIAIFGAAIAWIIAFRDIKLSTTVTLILEFFSISVIVVLAVIVLIRKGVYFDFDQLNLKGVTFDNFRTGLVLAFFSFVGFESAASLGGESKKPLKNIPRAISASIFIIGGLFVVLSYTEVLGFIGQVAKDASGNNQPALGVLSAPLSVLAAKNGVGFLGSLISVGALLSFWSSFLACTNAGARAFFSFGQDGVFSSKLGRTHAKNKTPHIAITVSTAIALIIPVILLGFGNDPLTIYGWVGTIATFGFLFSYILIAVAAPIYLKREKELKIRHVILSVITVLVLLVPLVFSVYPAQPMPYFLFPFIFIGWLVIGGIWYVYRRFKNPKLGSDISNRADETYNQFKISSEEINADLETKVVAESE
jgi:amino acid transporter